MFYLPKTALTKYNTIISLASVFLGTLLTSPSATAANIVWNGSAGDGLFTTGSNWDGGDPPENNDFRDIGVFGASATPTTVTLSSSRQISGIRFETANWTLTGSSFTDIRTVYSDGAGTNTFGSNFQLQRTSDWTVLAGNTLDFTSTSFYLKNNDINLSGGGTMTVDAGLAGFSGTVGDYGIFIQDETTLRFNTGAPAGNAAAIFIDNQAAKLQVLTTVAGAQSLVSSGRIVDNVGNGLQFSDIGGGYTEITAVPEPGTYALLLGSIIALVCLRKKQL